MSTDDPLNPPPPGTKCDLCRIPWHVRKLAEVKLPWWDDDGRAPPRRRGKTKLLICPSCWEEILFNWDREEKKGENKC